MSRNPAEPDASMEGKFTYHVALPTLQEMACYKVSLTIWNRYISMFKPHSFKSEPFDDDEDLCNPAFGLDYDYWDDVDKYTMCLEVPTSILEMIRECNKKVINETKLWLFHFRTVLISSESLEHYLIRNFDPDCCVWSPNGKIDYVKTAARMVASPALSKTNKFGLTKAQKFAIMSNYCMEDEIIAFPPPPKNFVQLASFNEEPLIFYWNCYRRKELHNVPMDNPDHSTDFVMALKCCDQTWTAFEYFWNRLNAEDQIIAAKHRLLTTATGQERLLVKMSWSQQFRLLREMPAKIIENFWLSLDMSQSALWAWKYANDLLTPEEFTKIVTKVFKSKYDDDDEMDLLVEMWHMAPNRLKTRVAKTQEGKIVELFVACVSNNASSNAKKLLLRILSSKKTVPRKIFFLENLITLFPAVEDFRFMDDVFNLCLPSPKDRLKLKGSLLLTEDMVKCFCDLLGKSNFDRLRSFVEFCTPDVSSALICKKEFVNQIIITEYLPVLDTEGWVKFSNFIDECFPNDQSSASNFKRKLISSFVENFQYDWRCTEKFTGIMKSVESTFQSEELERMKRKLSNSFLRVSTDQVYFSSFLMDKFFEFVSWCFCNDERALLEYKNSLPVDSVFDYFFHQTNEAYFDETRWMPLQLFLPFVEKFLMWIFSDAEKVNDYKMKKIYESDDLEIINSFSARRDESNLQMLLEWFFNDDEAKIRQFRSKKLKTE